MNDPNNKISIGAENIYGFRILNSNTILAIALHPRSTNECLFIGKKGDSLAMKQNDCTLIPSVDDLDKYLTSTKIKVTNFDISENYTITDNAASLVTSFVRIKISVEDPNDPSIKFDWQTAYSLSYLTAKSFFSVPFSETNPKFEEVKQMVVPAYGSESSGGSSPTPQESPTPTPTPSPTPSP